MVINQKILAMGIGVRRNYSLLFYLFSPFLFYVLCGRQYIWSQNLLQLWYLMMVLFSPIGIVMLSSMRGGLTKDAVLWMSIPVGVSLFMVILAFWASLGLAISTQAVLLLIYPLTGICALLLMRGAKNTLSDIWARMKEREEVQGGGVPYVLGYVLMLFLVSRWYGQYPFFPGEVDGQAIAGLLNKISEHNSYTSFYEPKLDAYVGTYYPPAFLVFAAFIKNLYGWMPIQTMMVVTQILLTMIPVVAMVTVSAITRNPVLIFVAAAFSIPSGFYDHMNYAGSTDAMGLFAASVSLFCLSRVGFGGTVINWVQAILVGVSLALALLSNTIYFFYVAPGIVIALILYWGCRNMVRKFAFASAIDVGTAKSVSIKLVVSMLIAVLLSFPTSKLITANQEKVNGSYFTTEENMMISHAPELLYERLSAKKTSGGSHRQSIDVLIVLLGFIPLLIKPRLVSLVMAGSISYICFHLSADWILNYLWCPDFIRKSFGLYLYGIDPAVPGVSLPFIYKYHSPFDFSWIALDVFIPFMLVTLLIFAHRLWSVIKNNKDVAWIVFLGMLVVLSGKLGGGRITDDGIHLKDEVYALWRGVVNVKPANMSPDLVSYIKENTDPKNTLILVPNWEFSFSELWFSNRWEFGWLGMLTGREINEARYLVFLNLKGMTTDASSSIYSQYSQKHKDVASLNKVLYSESDDSTPKGGYLRAGITHAVTPAGITSMILKRREDVELVFQQTGSCQDSGTCYDIIKFKR